MAVVYQTSASDGAFSVSSKSVSLSFAGGVNPLYVAIITTFESSTTPKDVTDFSRAGQVFTEAVDLRKDLTVTGSRFNRRKIFVFYHLGSATAGIQSATATLSGTAGYVSVSVVQYLGAYQGAAALSNYILVHGESVAGSVGFSASLLDTRVESVIMGHLQFFKSADGGNGFALINTVNLANSAGGSAFSSFWADVSVKEPFTAEFVTDMGTGWKENVTNDDMSADYLFFGIEIKDSAWTPSVPGVDPATYCAYVSNGQIRKMVTAISGLDHLEGETIKVQVDGVLPEGDNAFLVTGGAITLPNKAAVVHAGLGYAGTIKLLKASDSGGPGSGQGRMRRVFNLVIRLVRSLGLKIGTDEDHLDPVFDGNPVLPLLTQDIHKTPDATWDDEAEMVFKMDDPLPCQILAVIIESEVEGRK